MTRFSLRVLVFALAALAAAPGMGQSARLKKNDSAADARAPRSQKQDARASRSSEARAELSGRDPFALRAARNARPNDSKPIPAPEIATKTSDVEGGDDVLLLRDGTRLVGRLERLSGGDGATFVVDGATRRIPLAEIERIDADVSETFRRADEALTSGRRAALDSELRRALALFKESRATASRRFEKEWATAKIVETELALGLRDEAVVEFFLLCRLDPYAAFLPSVPLQWLNRRTARSDATPRAEDEAAKWLDRIAAPTNAPNPVGRLLAASVLLRSPRYGTKASDALLELSVCEAPDGAEPDAVETCRVVSLLAAAQRERDELLRKPGAKDVERWRRVADAIPDAWKPGPCALVGFGEKTLGNDADAARYLEIAAALALDRELARECAEELVGALTSLDERKAAAEVRASLDRAETRTESF